MNILPDQFIAARQEMVRKQLIGRGLKDARVLEAMASVPREDFIPAEFRNQAYEDHPLPIGEGQTISQPYIVAVTLAALELSTSSNVLEIGTGSGYQTALLSRLAGRVYSIERIEELASGARATLERLGYRNVIIITGDGTLGLPQHFPYDAIVVSAAAPRIPDPLLEQLGEGGRMVIPVGSRDIQQLQLVRKVNGRLNMKTLENCRFVPLVSDGTRQRCS
ncbi:MAG TPA: protein-L-isoaspartate(D-aspartate) O-methyltransferase [Terriglobales bacterium]|nr:protein-L-isoaspartate(D-aspartate) O-methyltransferase [Terriglobales bacterium]